MQDPHPVLQLLLRVDASATVAIFEGLPLLAEGVYCGTDDVAAAIAPLGLSELHCLAPQPVLSLRQAVVNAFAELVSRANSEQISSKGTDVPTALTTTGAKPSSTSAGDPSSNFPVEGPLRVVCMQIKRSPPAVLAPPLAAACIERLCTLSMDSQAMMEAVASAVALDSTTEQSLQSAGRALAPALKVLEDSRMWGPAALLYGRLRDLSGEMRCGLLHGQEVWLLLSYAEHKPMSS